VHSIQRLLVIVEGNKYLNVMSIIDHEIRIKDADFHTITDIRVLYIVDNMKELVGLNSLNFLHESQ